MINPLVAGKFLLWEEKTEMKKILAVLLIACMLLPLVACGDKNTPTTDPTTPSTPSTPGTSTTDPGTSTTDPGTTEPTVEPEKQWLPIVEPAGSKQLVIGITTSSNVLDYEDNAETRFYEEQTGIDIVFQQFAGSSSDVGTQIALMVASGEKLPDVLYNFGGVSSATGKEYGAEGYFADLTDYWNNPDYTHFTHESLTTIFGADQGEVIFQQLGMRATYSDDGRIYCWPEMEDVPMDSPCCHAYINRDWLKAVGKEIPHTVDELYDVLVAFRDKDPNGNGKKDEIPLLGRSASSYIDPVEWILNAFIYVNLDNHYNVENNKICSPYDTEEYRKALIYIKKLRDEGLMPEANFTSTAAERKTLFNPTDGVYTVGIACGHMDVSWLMDNEAVRHYDAIGPLADATGKGGYGCRSYYSMSFTTYVTADCPDVEMAVRFLDFTNSSEAYMRQRWGEYGVDWEWSDGKAASNAGNTPQFKKLNENTWGAQNSQCWHAVRSIASEYYYSYEITDYDPNNSDSCRVKNLVDNFNLYKAAGQPAQVYYFGNYNQEETDERNDFVSDLTSYISKSRTNFMSGTLDPSKDADWNEYLANLKALKYDRWIELAQNMWDREGMGNMYVNY